MCEPNRLSELAKLVEYMRALTTHELTHRVWMGDFNALTRSPQGTLESGYFVSNISLVSTSRSSIMSDVRCTRPMLVW